MRDRFEIWELGAFRALRGPDRDFAKNGLADIRTRTRVVRLGGAG